MGSRISKTYEYGEGIIMSGDSIGVPRMADCSVVHNIGCLS